MEFRHLGRSGLKISEITYGNWLTHGSQVENDVAKACVRAALDAGITSFDTADAYANGAAETVLGEALAGERRARASRSSRRCTGRPGRRGTTTAACRASTSWSRSTPRCAGCAPTTSTSTRRTGTTPRRRWRRRCRPSPTSSAQGKALYIGVSEWTAEQIRAGARAGRRAGDPAGLQPAAVLDAVAGHRGRGRADVGASSASPRSSARRSPRACSPASTGRASRRPPARGPPTRRAARTSSAASSPTTC